MYICVYVNMNMCTHTCTSVLCMSVVIEIFDLRQLCELITQSL